MGKKKGKKGQSQDSEGQGSSGDQQSQRGPQSKPSQGQQSQGGSHGQQPQRGPQGQQQRGPQGQQPQRGPQEQQQRGPPGQQQGGPPGQQQRGPPGHQQGGPPGQQRGPQGQQQEGPPSQQQRGPPGQQQGGPPGQQHRGAPGQQQWGPPGQQQRGPAGLQQGGPPGQQQRGPQDQQQRGPPGQQQWGPPGQQQRGPPGLQQGGPPGQQQRGPQDQQQRGPPGQQQWGPPGQQQWGSPGQQQWGPPGQQQRGPPGLEQGGPPGQQQRGPQGQQPQRGPQDQQQGRPYGQQPQRGPHGQQPQGGPQSQQQRGPQIQQPQSGPPQSQEQYQQPRPEGSQPQRGQQPQRGKGKGRPQQGVRTEPSHQVAPGSSRSTSISLSTEGSVESLTSQVSDIQIRPEQGQGDTQLIPMVSQTAIKPGTKGRKIIVETNHLPLNLGNLKTAIHYDVNLVPDTPKKMLRGVLEAFRRKHYPQRYPAFDGRKNLYSSSPLPFGGSVQDEIIIQDAEGRERKFNVEIKFANNVDLTPLRDLLKSKETPREAMQVVDIVLRSAPAVSCIPVGRSFFVKPSTIIELGEGMEMYNGFYQSAIRGWKPFLNVDVAHKAFPKNINLLDILVELFDSYYQPFRREDLSRPLSRYQQEQLNSFIKMLKVSYEIPNHPATRRVYRVNGIDMAPKDKTFKMDNGEQITIDRYFERVKNYRLRYSHLPTLWVGAPQRENKILLPLELCTLEEGQAVNRKMTENQTSRMIKHAATSTNVRKDKIMTALTRANHNADPTTREFGFSIGNAFEKLEARVLQPPELGYANRTVNPSRGVWRGERFFNGVTINKWTIACVDRRPPRPNDLTNLADAIFRNAASCGMTITNQAEKPFDHIGGQQNINDIKKFFQVKRDKQYDVIFVIVPNSGPQYSYVKTAAEINVGCLTQCLKSKTLNKMNQQTAINILLKVNSKLNGTNHVLVHRPPIMNRPCMIMGADVTHPSPDARNIPSVAAVTASHDPKAYQYNICWRLQPPKVEIIEDLEAITVEQLKYFYQKTKVKPERIVFFRDGVSEGQFEQVRNAEIRAIRSACKRLQADGYEPSITFLVVQKRHHTRLFPTNPKDSEDRNNNVPAGTCVDTTITHPYMQDFYLVSHASIQGVAKPTKYCTLWDDNKMLNDDIEQLTYYLCHMFSRCTRSVSYPAPTYYAHLAAARAKVYIENEQLNMDQLRREFERFQILDVIRKGLPMFFV